MAITLTCGNGGGAITLDEYIDFVQRKVDLRDLDSVADSAPQLRALANNRALVVEKLNRRVQDLVGRTEDSSPAVLILGRGQNFYVRASIWPAIADTVNGRAYQDQFAYNIAHDHNFTFMTVNYLGPGYETEIYEYDYEKVEGYIGEAVEMRFLEKKRFNAGSVMLYRASKDIHVQYPPEELTISLNLMISLPEVRTREQYYFDISRRVISGYGGEYQVSGRASLVALAAFIGNAETQQLLEELAKRHPCRRTRLVALESLSSHQPGRQFEIWSKATSDPAPLVAGTARRRLAALETAKR